MDSEELTLDGFVAALARQPELTLVGGRANFHLKGRRFLHLHDDDGRVLADVWLGRSREEHLMNTPLERLALLALVLDHLDVLRSRQRRSHSAQR